MKKFLLAPAAMQALLTKAVNFKQAEIQANEQGNRAKKRTAAFVRKVIAFGILYFAFGLDDFLNNVLPSNGVLLMTLVDGKPKNYKVPSVAQENAAPLKEKEKETCMACIEGECECRPHKDTKSSSIAIKAAQEAKEAQEAQQIAGAQAAHQVKAQLAEKAEQAARAAEAALSGKQVLVDQLEHEVREAQAVVQEEAASCQRTQVNLQISCAAAAQAGHLLKTLTAALQISQSNLVNTQEAAEGAQQELAEKAALLDAAKCRAEALIRELNVARQDLCAIKQAAYKAQSAARSAECNAQRNRRHSRHSYRAKKRIANLLGRAGRSAEEIARLEPF